MYLVADLLVLRLQVCNRVYLRLRQVSSSPAISPKSSEISPKIEASDRSKSRVPNDIDMDTLSRMPRVTESDFATQQEKQSFDRVVTLSPASREIGMCLGLGWANCNTSPYTCTRYTSLVPAKSPCRTVARVRLVPRRVYV